MSRDVAYTPAAERDLLLLYDYIAERSGADRAKAYTDTIQARCVGLAFFPERGTRRDDIRRGVRIIGFERRVTIAFHSTADAVIIDRVIYGGRDLSTIMR